MFKNKAFMKRALPLLILGVLYMFFYSGLQNDHLNVITPYLNNIGWTNAQVNNPATAATFVAIVFYLVCGAVMVKIGPVKFIVPSTILLGLTTIGVGFSQSVNSYAFYAVCLFLVRLLVVVLQMGCFMLCSNWFIKYRGRALGFVTIGSPLFSIFGIALLTWLVNNLGGLSVGYGIFGGVVVLMGIATLVFVKDTPEDCGLHADGLSVATSDEQEEESLSLKQLLSEKRAWQLIVSYGILQFIIMCMMAFMANRYIQLGGPELWGKALGYLSIGAALGIIISYVLGWIDDKVGSIKASLLLCVLYLFAVVPLAIMPETGSTALMFTWAFGVACMTGGCPTMHPCVTAYVYGRKKYQSANKWIMSIQAIIMAFALPYMNFFFAPGRNPSHAYYGLLILLAIAFVTILTMWKIPDANLADRDYAKK